MGETKDYTVSARLNEEQYQFLMEWKKDLESELGIDIPMGALLRRAVDFAAKNENTPRFRSGFFNGMDNKNKEQFMKLMHERGFGHDPSKLREKFMQWINEQSTGPNSTEGE